jgi:hypothetical protein
MPGSRARLINSSPGKRKPVYRRKWYPVIFSPGNPSAFSLPTNLGQGQKSWSFSIASFSANAKSSISSKSFSFSAIAFAENFFNSMSSKSFSFSGLSFLENYKNVLSSKSWSISNQSVLTTLKNALSSVTIQYIGSYFLINGAIYFAVSSKAWNYIGKTFSESLSISPNGKSWSYSGQAFNYNQTFTIILASMQISIIGIGVKFLLHFLPNMPALRKINPLFRR